MEKICTGDYLKTQQTMNIRGRLVEVTKPMVMGILNVTPDSFYDGGRYVTNQKIQERIEKMISEGADIIDIGGMSTRPGAEVISAEEEIDKIVPALDLIRNYRDEIIISVDTYHSETAHFVLEKYPVGMINDITGGQYDSSTYNIIAACNVPYVLMHMQGMPGNMQKNPQYNDVVSEIIQFFSGRIAKLRDAGVHDIIIDPGFGFGKTQEHNYEILNNLSKFKIFELPLLVGVSRKSMVHRLLQITADEALNGTTVLHAVALLNGALILRVHDVKEAVQTIQIVQALKKI
jgi:dihydropteroate synthase